jgi:hypothetical protein
VCNGDILPLDRNLLMGVNTFLDKKSSCLLGLLIEHWGQVAVGRMTALAIVKHLNVIEDDIPSLLTGFEGLKIDTFGL